MFKPSHVQFANRERYIFFSFPHTAVDPDGEIGHLQRPGRVNVSYACGAIKLALTRFQSTGMANGEPHCPMVFCMVIFKHSPA